MSYFFFFSFSLWNAKTWTPIRDDALFIFSFSLFSLAFRCSNDFNCELSLNSILESFDFSAMPYFIYIERKTTTKSSSNNNNCRNKTNDHWLTQNFTQFFQYSSSLLCINNFFFVPDFVRFFSSGCVCCLISGWLQMEKQKYGPILSICTQTQ